MSGLGIILVLLLVLGVVAFAGIVFLTLVIEHLFDSFDRHQRKRDEGR